MNYDSSFKVAAMTTMIGQTLFLGVIPIFSWPTAVAHSQASTKQTPASLRV